MYILCYLTEYQNYIEVQRFKDYKKAINGLIRMIEDYPKEKWYLLKRII